MMRIVSRLESVSSFSRIAFLVAAVTSAAFGTVARAQIDAATLREINQINARAAADSFGSKTAPLSDGTMRLSIERINAQAAASAFGNIPSQAAPTDSSSAAQSPLSSSISPSASGSSGSSGFTSLAQFGAAPNSVTSDASSTVPGPNPSANSDQPSEQAPSALEEATPSSVPHDSQAEDSTPTASAPTTKARRATVTYESGLLTVEATDSSLNLILRQIAHLTGMTITGGVADERVFGKYGPSKPSVVLSTLLDGTSSNVVLHQGSSATVTELVLIPRGRGPVPPNPNNSVWGSDDAGDGQ